MNNKSNLPVKYKTNLPQTLKNIGLKSLKVAGLSAAALASLSALFASVAFAPVLFPPAVILSLYTGQKILNNTRYTSYKDLDFVLKKHNNNFKIYQDFFRPSMVKEFIKLNDLEKIGFMQLQAIVGISKFKSFDKKSDDITFETDTHSLLQKTFKKLQTLGYINNYSETFLKSSNLIAAKLALGNFKNLNEKTDFYNLTFNITDKQMDLDDENLKSSFPLVFGKKHGILNKYSLAYAQDGSLQIDYSKKSNSNTNLTFSKTTPSDFKKKNKVDISLTEQSSYVKNLTKKENYHSEHKKYADMENIEQK